MNHARKNLGWAVAVALASTTLAGCTREEVDRDLDHLKEGSQRVTRKVDQGLENAKREAEQVKDKLPPKEEIAAELRQAGATVEAKLKAAGENAKLELDQARDAVRDSVRDDAR